MLAAGYRFVLADAINRFYLAEEHLDLAPNFALVADNFYQWRDYWELDAARHRIPALEREAAALQAAHSRIAELEANLGALHAARERIAALEAEIAALKRHEPPKGFLSRIAALGGRR